MSQAEGTILLEIKNEEEIMWEFQTEMLVCEDMTLPIAMLSIRLLHSAIALHSNSYYTVASIFLVNAASCKEVQTILSHFG